MLRARGHEPWGIASRSRSRPRALWLLTFPSLHPMASAVSAMLSPSTYRSTTAVRMPAGKVASSATTAVASRCGSTAAKSGSCAETCSRLLNRLRRSSTAAFTTQRRHAHERGPLSHDELGELAISIRRPLHRHPDLSLSALALNTHVDTPHTGINSLHVACQ